MASMANCYFAGGQPLTNSYNVIFFLWLWTCLSQTHARFDILKKYQNVVFNVYHGRSEIWHYLAMWIKIRGTKYNSKSSPGSYRKKYATWWHGALSLGRCYVKPSRGFARQLIHVPHGHDPCCCPIAIVSPARTRTRTRTPPPPEKKTKLSESGLAVHMLELEFELAVTQFELAFELAPEQFELDFDLAASASNSNSNSHPPPREKKNKLSESGLAAHMLELEFELAVTQFELAFELAPEQFELDFDLAAAASNSNSNSPPPRREKKNKPFRVCIHGQALKDCELSAGKSGARN